MTRKSLLAAVLFTVAGATGVSAAPLAAGTRGLDGAANPAIVKVHGFHSACRHGYYGWHRHNRSGRHACHIARPQHRVWRWRCAGGRCGLWHRHERRWQR